MTKFFTAFLFILLSLASAQAQTFRKADPVICPADYNAHNTFVPPPIKFLNAKTRTSAERLPSKANIVVNYSGFTDEARIAYQYAVDIWASLLKSPVTIYVDASFEDLGQGVLGSAGPTNYVTNFPGAPNDTVYYPIALADKLAGYSLNNDGEADITSRFSSTFNFYFGLDGNPPASQYDFVSIVLHELGHGLGFTGAVSFNPNSSEGSWDLGTTQKSSIYTSFVQFGNGDNFTDLPFESAETGDALTSNDLFFNALLSSTKLGERPKLFSPSDWNQGSSFSHLDENEYPEGDPNSLMSPQFGLAEAIHDPGITLDIFGDMGWIHTYLNHQNENKITSNSSEPFIIDLSVKSDTNFSLLEPMLIFTTSTFENADTIIMTDTGDGINFQAAIPNPGNEALIKYFFSGVTDGTGRQYNSPSLAPNRYYDINILNLTAKTLPYTIFNGGDFETNAGDFKALALSGGINLWEYGVPGNILSEAPSGSNVWKTLLQDNIERSNNRYSSALLSPIFDFSDDTKNHLLKFKFSMENAFTQDVGLFSSGPIGLNVEYSLDNGQSWALLGEKDDEAGTNWYNVKENSPSVFPAQSESGWIKQTIEVVDGDTVFIPEEVNLNVSSLAGNQNVVFRIVFYVAQEFISAGYNVDGVLIDDFELITGNPTAEFRSNANALVFQNQNIDFQYVSTGASSYLWNFGDGQTSTLENPSHAYLSGGVYDVSLTITNPDGEVTLTKENYISVLSIKQVPYLIADGGNLEGETSDFLIVNIAGTGFERGNSTIAGKDGTASGGKAFITGIGDDTYMNDSEAYIYTPEFDFKGLGNYSFSFQTKYSFEPNWDGFIVEYSTNRGESWLKLQNEIDENTWYNSTSDPLSIFGDQVPFFSGSTQGNFLKKSADVSFLGGKGNTSFRIKFLTDAAAVDAGMAIDDFELNGPSPGPALPDFEADMLNTCSETVITFKNVSDGTIKSLQWDFGEGAAPRTATGNGPHEVSYDTPGVYSVSLIAEDFTGAFITEEKQSYIQVGAAHVPTIEVGEMNTSFERTLTASQGTAYQWFKGTDSIQNATEQVYISSETGVYSVAVVKDGCLGFSISDVITSNLSPLEESLKIFPNPVNKQGSLTISFINEYIGRYEVSLYNLSGALLKRIELSKNGNEETTELSIGGLAKGLYLINIHTGESITQRKIVIE